MALFIITAPSGAGKTTLVKDLQKSCVWQEVISHTTRPMREGEVEGETYYYVDRGTFREMWMEGDFAENVAYGGSQYGISHAEIKRVSELSAHTVIIAEYEGYKQLKKLYPNAVGIFIYMERHECLQNMLGRGDTIKDALKRIDTYESEMLNRGHYDYVIKNVANRRYETGNILSQIVYTKGMG